MDWLSLLLPFAYLGTLITSLAAFSYLYRRRKLIQAARLEPWFPSHETRDIYLSLLELQSKPDVKVPDSILRAALFRRAIEDIHRLIQIRNSKPALQQLLQKGSVGDELWQRFQRAEKEIELELKDVVNEANALGPQQQWGQSIFLSAGEAAQREMLQEKLTEIEARRQEEKDAWEERKESVREGFMKELDGDDEASGSRPTTASSAGKKQHNSDEDGVLVDISGPGDTNSPSGSAKKKKGKR